MARVDTVPSLIAWKYGWAIFGCSILYFRKEIRLRGTTAHTLMAIIYALAVRWMGRKK
jgi:hypothetical protein